jgi:hypothetical protein
LLHFQQITPQDSREFHKKTMVIYLHLLYRRLLYHDIHMACHDWICLLESPQGGSFLFQTRGRERMALPYGTGDSFQKKRNAEMSKAIFGNHPALGTTALKSPIQPAKTQPIDIGMAYDNNQKMKYRQQGENALKPVEPFKMDLASIQSDPTYQAAMESAKQATQVAEGDISALMNRRGIMDSSINAQTSANAAQREYGKVNRELLPQLIQDQYKRYIDQANMNRQYASDLFGVSDMYANDEQTALNNALNISDRTGTLITPELDALGKRLVNHKTSTEALWSTLTPEQRQAARLEGDRLRAQIEALGGDASLLGADVTANTARGNLGSLGVQTLAAQNQNFNQNLAQQQLDRGILESDRAFNEDTRRYNQEFEYTQGRDEVKDAQWQAEFDRIKDQDGIQNAIAWANQTLNRDQFEDSSARDWAGLDFEMQNAGGAKSTFTPAQVRSDIERKYQPFFNGEETASPSDYEAMYRDIINYGLDEAAENDILRSVGMTEKQIAAFDKKYLSGNQ